MNNKITKIVILGGGTAGWLSAGLLAAEHPNLSVTLIESENLPILGVGEGTWPSMRNTLQRIGIDETDFINHCEVSFKQGSKFINWRNLDKGENYYHPFMNPQGYEHTNLHAHWQRRAPDQKFADVVNMQSFVCQAALAPKQLQTPEYAAVTNYGNHLDAGKFAEFLKLLYSVEKNGHSIYIKERYENMYGEPADRIIGIDLGFMKVKFARYEVFLDKTKVKSSNIEKKTNSTSIGIPLPI